jgi:hypothetical protein
MMRREEIESAVSTIVQDLGLRDAQTTVELNRQWVHLLVSSPSFEGKTARERENMVWKEIEKHLDDNTILSITQCYLVTPEERKSIAIS